MSKVSNYSQESARQSITTPKQHLHTPTSRSRSHALLYKRNNTVVKSMQGALGIGHSKQILEEGLNNALYNLGRRSTNLMAAQHEKKILTQVLTDLQQVKAKRNI
jgi:hypothetical protein